MHISDEFESWNSPQAYQAAIAESETQCVTWRWATEEMADLEPFYSEKKQFRKGKWVSDKASDKFKHYLHGLDERDRVCLVREFVEFPSGIATRELVFRYLSPERIDAFRFKEDELLALEKLFLQNNMPNRFEAFAKYGHLKCTYECDPNGVIRESCIHESREPPFKVTRYGFDFTYDGVGRLYEIKRVEHGADGTPLSDTSEVVYRRPGKGETIKELAGIVQTHLEQEIPTVLEAANISDRVYCLLLVYDAENDALPPALALGREDDRRRIVERSGKKAKYYLWNPAEDMIFNLPELELTNSRLLEACRMMNQLLTQKGTIRPAVNMLDNVCKTLASRTWGNTLDVTDDFVVATIDLEGSIPVSKSLKKTDSLDRLRELQSKSLV